MVKLSMRRTTLLIISFLLSIAILVVYSLQPQDTKLKLTYSESPYIEDVMIKHLRDGITKWTVSAQKANFINTNDVVLKRLKITFPEKDLILTSEEGVYNMASQSIRIEGNIQALTENYVINASTLSWDPQKNQLSSDNKIQIIGKEFYIEGDELTASSDKARLNSNVRAVFK